MSDGNKVTWEEREEPRQIKFGTGDVIEGLLVQMVPMRLKDTGNETFRYTVELSESKEWITFLGTNQLLKKIRISDIAHKIRIECIGEDVTVKRGDSFMKVFRVQVSREKFANLAPQVSSDALVITDEDIPF